MWAILSPLLCAVPGFLCCGEKNILFHVREKCAVAVPGCLRSCLLPRLVVYSSAKEAFVNMNTKQPVITKSTVKLLKFIMKHPSITFEELQLKFKEIDFMELVLLCLTDYLVCTKPGNLPTNFSDGRFVVAPTDEFWASPKTEQLLEERFQRRWQWIVPTVFQQSR